jgi:hypothetical protein
MTRYLLLIAYSFVLASCGAELAPLDPEPECVKTWTVEINNPEATVKIENGRLIVDIQNPKTPQDVRLIQMQDANSLNDEIGIGITLSAFETVAVNASSNDAHVKASFAYLTKPEQPFISKVKGAYGSRGYSMDRELYRNYASESFSFYASGTEAKFNKSSEPNALHEIPQVTSAAKICYLDFGVNPIFTQGNPTQSLHVEIDIIAFGDHTDGGLSLVSGYNTIQYGFRVDEFFCNTLK